ncbi:site-specific integrase [Planctomycetales bacterium ZRK34]|nr:site-specific integrase [Planctomycetales bacterium ZRK34]
MSSVSSDKSGNRTIYVSGADRRRRPIRLGKCSLKDARIVQGYVDDLERAANHNGTPSEKTATWLADIGDDLREKLARAGLVAQRGSVRLGAFIDSYIDRRKGTMKPATLVRVKQARTHLVGYLGENKPLASVTAGDAEDYRAHLLDTEKGKGMAEATTRRNCGYASTWFRYAIKHGHLRQNPFADVPTAAMSNTDRQRYISDEDARKVSAKLPDAEWRLLFALARYGGLRTPSESAALTWADVDWENRRLVIHSPKTERHDGHDKRVIPLFAEIEAPLREVFEKAAEGALHVLPFLRTRTAASLRKPLEKAITAAGLNVWPRLWHNLRASRQTELEERHPSHVVCTWLGNSESVARAHYLQVRDSDYDKALENVVRQTVRAVATDAANARQGEGDDSRELANKRQKTLSTATGETSKWAWEDSNLRPHPYQTGRPLILS